AGGSRRGAAAAPTLPGRAAADAEELQARYREMAQLEERRQQLAEVQRFLAASEQQMVRRWARPRAVVTVLWFVALAVMVGGVSWLVTGWIAPQPVTASVTLEARTRDAQPLSPEQA